MEAPPSSWAVLSLPDDQGTKVLMAIDNTIYELDSFQPKTKVRFHGLNLIFLKYKKRTGRKVFLTTVPYFCRILQLAILSKLLLKWLSRLTKNMLLCLLILDCCGLDHQTYRFMLLLREFLLHHTYENLLLVLFCKKALRVQ